MAFIVDDHIGVMKYVDGVPTIKQWNEPVTDYIQRFRDIRSICFRLSLSDSLLAELAFQGLLSRIKERFSSHEFESLSHLALRMACVDVRTPVQMQATFQKKSTSPPIHF